MLRSLFLAMTIFALPTESAFADAGPDMGGNAALKYWQAFATLPRFTDAEEKKLGEYLTIPLDTQARDLVAKADYALQMMHRGAALRHCEWGIGSEDGIYVRLPHINAARVLSSLASLRARIRFEEGHNAEAIEDIVAALTLGRQVSPEGGFVILLAGYGMEHRMIETLGLYLPRLDPQIIKNLKTRLDALPPF